MSDAMGQTHGKLLGCVRSCCDVAAPTTFLLAMSDPGEDARFWQRFAMLVGRRHQSF